MSIQITSMKLNKHKHHSRFQYTPRFHDPEKDEWTARKNEVKRKVEKEGYSYEDFIKFRSQNTNRFRKIAVLLCLVGTFFAIPIYYGMGIVQLCAMMMVGLGFVKLSNVFNK